MKKRLRFQRFLLPLLGISVLATATSACISSVNEGLNINDMNVTVLIPKTLATSAEGIGVIYVGLYSGIATVIDSAFQMDLPLALPVQAPGSGTSAGETYPYAGTALGDYLTRDARFICAKAFDLPSPATVGSNWAFQVPLLQFPFYPGARLWAFSDQAVGPTAMRAYHPTCNQNLGRFDAFQEEVQMVSVAPSLIFSSGFDVTLVPTDVNAHTPAESGGVADKGLYEGINFFDSDGWIPVAAVSNPLAFQPYEYLVDAGSNYWKVSHFKSVVFGTSNSLVATVVPFSGDHPPAPVVQGANQPQRIYLIDGNFWPYGAQANDVLNLPQRYVYHGDFMTSSAAAITLSSPADTTLTLDMKVP